MIERGGSMEHSNKLKEHIQAIVGKQLTGLNLACEMMMFSFGDYELHAQCFARIILDQELITTTLDYQSWDGENDCNNDEWFFTERYREQIVGGVVLDVEISPIHDLVIQMDNGIRIELFMANGLHHYGEEREQWVFFKHDDSGYPFISVRSGTVDIRIEE